ncbi:hypothetical protein NQZ68_035330, partial [Dissostichus eleginoides]
MNGVAVTCSLSKTPAKNLPAIAAPPSPAPAPPTEVIEPVRREKPYGGPLPDIPEGGPLLYPDLYNPFKTRPPPYTLPSTSNPPSPSSPHDIKGTPVADAKGGPEKHEANTAEFIWLKVIRPKWLNPRFTGPHRFASKERGKRGIIGASAPLENLQQRLDDIRTDIAAAGRENDTSDDDSPAEATTHTTDDKDKDTEVTTGDLGKEITAGEEADTKKDWDAEWYGQVLRINEDKDYLTPVRPRIVYFMAAIKDDLGLIGGAGDPKFPHLWLTHSDSLFRPRRWLTHCDSLPRARPGVSPPMDEHLGRSNRHNSSHTTPLLQKASKTGKTAEALAEILKIHDEQELHDINTRRTTVIHSLPLYLQEDTWIFPNLH